MAFHQGDLGWSCRPKSNGIIGFASLKIVSLSTGKYTQKESGCQLNFFWQVDPFLDRRALLLYDYSVRKYPPKRETKSLPEKGWY